MPIYTCTTVKSVLTADVKAELAAHISHIHSVIKHVPSTQVNVVFQELPPASVYTDRTQTRPLLITGWFRNGRQEVETARLATEITEAATRTTGIPDDRVLVVFDSAPVQFA